MSGKETRGLAVACDECQIPGVERPGSAGMGSSLGRDRELSRGRAQIADPEKEKSPDGGTDPDFKKERARTGVRALSGLEIAVLGQAQSFASSPYLDLVSSRPPYRTEVNLCRAFDLVQYEIVVIC